MDILSVVAVFTILLAVRADTPCNEEELTRCLRTLEALLTDHAEKIKKAEADITTYCENLQVHGDCLLDASESCKQSHPSIAKHMASFNAFLNHFCVENGEIYRQFRPCLETYKQDFSQCWNSQPKAKKDDVTNDICLEIEPMYCVAETSRKKCTEAEKFVNILDERLKLLDEAVCSITPSQASSVHSIPFWCLLVMAGIYILLTNKL